MPVGPTRWKVLWKDEDGRTRYKKHEADVKAAVAHRNELKESGLEAYVISMNHAYSIPKLDKKGKRHPKADRPSSQHWWCPYCIEWRVFVYTAIRFKEEGVSIRGPEDWRCPVCTVSDHEYYIRKFNGRLDSVDNSKLYKGVITMQNVK